MGLLDAIANRKAARDAKLDQARQEMQTVVNAALRPDLNIVGAIDRLKRHGYGIVGGTHMRHYHVQLPASKKTLRDRTEQQVIDLAMAWED